MKRCVLILGMHRSGSSALMGVLKILGLKTGRKLLGPVPESNVRGHFEHREILEVNENILKFLGSGWDDLSALPKNWYKKKGIPSFKKR